MNIHAATTALRTQDRKKLAEFILQRTIMHAVQLATKNPFENMLGRIAARLNEEPIRGDKLNQFILEKYLEAATQNDPRTILENIALDTQNWFHINAKYAITAREINHPPAPQAKTVAQTPT